MRKTNIVRAAAMAAVLAASLLVTPQPAQASLSQCPAGYFCAWSGGSFTGSFGYFRCCHPDLRFLGSGGLYNNISSVWDRTGKIWCLFDGLNYTGAYTSLPKGIKGGVGGFNNRTSSLHVSKDPNNSAGCRPPF